MSPASSPALDAALAGIRYEILFVDDWSQDGTAARIAEIAADRADIRVIRRFDRRGLSSAVIEGMMATIGARRRGDRRRRPA